MAEAEATFPEKSESIEPVEAPAPQEPAQEPVPEPKRGRGRPAGSKDRAPRTKPKVRVEPIPQPEPKLHPPLLWRKGPQAPSPLLLARSSARPRRTCSTSET